MSKHPEGTTHFCPAFGRYPATAWKYERGSNLWQKWSGYEWYIVKFGPTYAIREQFVAVGHRAPTKWRGPEDGLPPVGLEVEVRLRTPSDWTHWCAAKVLFCRDNAFVFEWKAEGVAHPTTFDQVQARPIRTPEQIKAEQREKAVAKLAAVIRDSGWESPEILAAYLDSHGYCKFEIVDEQP